MGYDFSKLVLNKGKTKLIVKKINNVFSLIVPKTSDEPGPGPEPGPEPDPEYVTIESGLYSYKRYPDYPVYLDYYVDKENNQIFYGVRKSESEYNLSEYKLISENTFINDGNTMHLTQTTNDKITCTITSTEGQITTYECTKTDDTELKALIEEYNEKIAVAKSGKITSTYLIDSEKSSFIGKLGATIPNTGFERGVLTPYVTDGTGATIVSDMSIPTDPTEDCVATYNATNFTKDIYEIYQFTKEGQITLNAVEGYNASKIDYDSTNQTYDGILGVWTNTNTDTNTTTYILISKTNYTIITKTGDTCTSNTFDYNTSKLVYDAETSTVKHTTTNKTAFELYSTGLVYNSNYSSTGADNIMILSSIISTSDKKYDLPNFTKIYQRTNESNAYFAFINNNELFYIKSVFEDGIHKLATYEYFKLVQDTENPSHYLLTTPISKNSSGWDDYVTLTDSQLLLYDNDSIDVTANRLSSNKMADCVYTDEYINEMIYLHNLLKDYSITATISDSYTDSNWKTPAPNYANPSYIPMVCQDLTITVPALNNSFLSKYKNKSSNNFPICITIEHGGYWSIYHLKEIVDNNKLVFQLNGGDYEENNTYNICLDYDYYPDTKDATTTKEYVGCFGDIDYNIRSVKFNTVNPKTYLPDSSLTTGIFAGDYFVNEQADNYHKYVQITGNGMNVWSIYEEINENASEEWPTDNTIYTKPPYTTIYNKSENNKEIYILNGNNLILFPDTSDEETYVKTNTYEPIDLRNKTFETIESGYSIEFKFLNDSVEQYIDNEKVETIDNITYNSNGTIAYITYNGETSLFARNLMFTKNAIILNDGNLKLTLKN